MPDLLLVPCAQQLMPGELLQAMMTMMLHQSHLHPAWYRRWAQIQNHSQFLPQGLLLTPCGLVSVHLWRLLLDFLAWFSIGMRGVS